MIRFGFSCSVIFAKILATARGCRPSYSLSFNKTWIPRSAPIARAVRRVSFGVQVKLLMLVCCCTQLRVNIQNKIQSAKRIYILKSTILHNN